MMTITLIGRSTQDVTMQTSANGNEYVRFSVAVNEGSRDNQVATFLNISAFNGVAQRIAKGKVKKGSLLSLTGRFSQGEYTNRDGIKVKTLDVILHDWTYVPFNTPKDAATGTDVNQEPSAGQPADEENLTF